jgi:hypothetical protein
MAATVLSLFVLLLVVMLTGLLIALWVVPITICGTIGYAGGPSADLQTRWGVLGIAIRPGDETEIRISLVGRTILSRRLKPKPAAPPERIPEIPEIPIPVEKEERIGPSPLEVVRKLYAAWPYLKKPLLTGLRSLHLEYLTCTLRLGFDDPATTGEVYGQFWALKGMLSPIERLSLTMTPFFDREVIEGTGLLCIAVRRPLLILLAFATALTKKPVRDLLTLGAR